MTLWRPTVAPLICVLSAGCAALLATSPQPERDRGDPTKLVADRAGCRDFSDWTRFDSLETHEDRLLWAICQEEFGHDAYEELGDRLVVDKLDALDTAVLVIACVGRGKCRFGQAKDWYDPYCVPQGGNCNFSPSRNADVAFWAERVDVAMLRQALTGVELPVTVKADLATRYDACRSHVLEAARSIDARRQKLYGQTIADVRARRAEDDQAWAAFHQQLAAAKPRIDAILLDGKASRALLDDTVALRDAFVSDCMGRGRSALYCLTGPVARPLTKLVVRLAIALEDKALAATENAVLALGPSQEDVVTEIRLAVDRAMAEELKVRAEWKKAKDAGTDDTVLTAKFGDPPPANVRDEDNQPGAPVPGIFTFQKDIDAMSGEVDHVARALKRVDRRGTRAVLVFKDVVTRSEQQTGCRESNKVDSIGSNGEIYYRVNCSGPWVTRVSRDRVPPIEVPAVEATHLKAGQYVLAIAAGKKRGGHVLQVFASEQAAGDGGAIQLRGFRAAP